MSFPSSRISLKRLLLPIAVIAALSGAAAALDDATVHYQTLLAAAKANPAGVDWQALRFAFADQPDFIITDLKLNATRAKMMSARQNGNFEELLLQANAVIDQNYVDGHAHLMASTALAALHQPGAGRERSIAIAIFKSIQTGDGQTPATAFSVISVAEEYELLGARQRKPTSQSLQTINGHAYDVMTTIGQAGDSITYYFLIDRVLAAEAKAFKPQK